jgi:hypothetical protein
LNYPENLINSNSTDSIRGRCTASDGSPIAESQNDIDYNIAVYARSGEGSAIPFVGHIGPGEMCEEHTRILSITYPYGKSDIVIQGTVMVPEFGLTLSTLVMAIGITAAVIWINGIAMRRRRTA